MDFIKLIGMGHWVWKAVIAEQHCVSLKTIHLPLKANIILKDKLFLLRHHILLSLKAIHLPLKANYSTCILSSVFKDK